MSVVRFMLIVLSACVCVCIPLSASGKIQREKSTNFIQEPTLTELWGVVQHQTKEIRELKSTIKAMKDQDEQRIKRQASGISFSVYLDHDDNLAVNQVLRFNQVITNEGNGYNKYTGAFTCPQAGVYLLTFTIATRDVAECWIHLIINDVNILDAVVETRHSYQDSQGSNTVIKRLNVGDTVMIEHQDKDVCHLEGSAGLRLTSFSGVLLYA